MRLSASEGVFVVFILAISNGRKGGASIRKEAPSNQSKTVSFHTRCVSVRRRELGRRNETPTNKTKRRGWGLTARSAGNFSLLLACYRGAEGEHRGEKQYTARSAKRENTSFSLPLGKEGRRKQKSNTPREARIFCLLLSACCRGAEA